jgi:[acyl-carrier-protein] S-malonyltransferase
VTAAPLDTADITTNLAMQVVSPVRFAESLGAMAAAGIDTFVHVGPGDVTAAMAKRTIEGARIVTVSQLADVDAAVEAING